MWYSDYILPGSSVGNLVFWIRLPKTDRSPSSLQRIQALFRDHGLLVLHDATAVQVLIKDLLAALG